MSPAVPGRDRLRLLACAGTLTVFSGLGALQAQTGPAPTQWAKARDAVSEKALQTQMSAARPLNDQLAAMMRPLDEIRPSTENSLYTRSIILFDGEMHTLIPVGSVLHLPAPLRNRVIATPKGDFTFWPNFLKRNAAWLEGKEVPLSLARGDAKLAEAMQRETAQSTRLLVSVYRQCPISILEPPAPKEAAQKQAKEEKQP